ncbi:MAG: hypothetical protein ACOY0T_35675 [Myxococcota bacterium]
MSDLDYTVVVPSRKRAHNMPLILSLLPTALICVEDSERDEYAAVVPKKQLLLHPPVHGGFGGVVNWMMDTVQSEILIEVDDDFRRIIVKNGSMQRGHPDRKITDPREILQILENSARVCRDVGLTTFTYTRNNNAAMTHPEEKPFVPVAPVSNVFGVMGAARRRYFDPRFMGRAAIDWTLTTLLYDRAIYCDQRFWWDCGEVFGGRGGNVGLVTPDRWRASTRALIEKWGPHLSFDGQRRNGKKGNKSVESMSLRVTRRNPTAQK